MTDVKNTIPSWMMEEDVYEPSKDKDRFIEQTNKGILKTVSRMKYHRERDSRVRVCPALRLLCTWILVLLVSLTSSINYMWIIGAFLLVSLALLKSSELSKVLVISIPASIMSVIMMLPAFLITGNLHTFVLPVKVFMSVAFVMIMAVTYDFHVITAALKTFFVPNLFIFILDMTIKYIVLLSEVSSDLLIALKLRSVGKNKRKGDALGGILGVTFLKSKQKASEMMEAMTTRGFTGQYYVTSKVQLKWIDFLYIIMVVWMIFFFWYLR